MDYLDDILGDAVETAQSNSMVPMLLVDTSYLTYHSMFSAINSFKEKYSDLCPPEILVKGGKKPDWDPAQHPEFLQILKERFVTSVMTSPLKVHPFIEESNIIFAQDCPKSKIWRIEVFKEYKQERRDASDDDKAFSFSGSFRHVYDTIIPEFIDNGSKLISAPCCEGDDIIAVLTRNKIADNIIILASDRDLLQLVQPGVIMINVAGDPITFSKELEIPEEELEAVGFTGKNYILIKAMMGDRSDGIPQIHTRCGKKTATKYFFDKGLLRAKMDTDPNIAEIIKSNLAIMDFDYIPQEINDAVMSAYKG